MRRAVGGRSRIAAAATAVALLLGAGVSSAHAEDAPTIRVSGTVLVLPDEPGTAERTRGVFLASTAGPILPLDAAALTAATGGAAGAGDRIDGTVELPPSIARVLADAGSRLDEQRALSLVATTASAMSEALPLSDATVSRRASAAAPSPQHRADIVFVSKRTEQAPGSVPSENDMRELLQRASDYWSGQLSGRITGVTANQLRRIIAPVGGDVCDAEAAWEWAAAQFGKAPSDYGRGGSGDHLIVLISDDGAECGVGLGSVGPKLSGGLVWVNLSDEPFEEATHTLAHELGHNFDLDHANARFCEGAAVDALYDATGRVKPPCQDLEYGDLWSTMGVGVTGLGKQPALISLGQLSYLGAVPSGALATVPASGGSGRVFTLNALSAGVGLRGLRVQPDGADAFFVEYRDGAGRDAGMPRPLELDFDGTPLSAGVGVKVVKTPPAQFGYGAASVVLSPWRSNGHHNETLAEGEAIRPVGGATVTVLSISGQQARVRIDFPAPQRFTAAPKPRITGKTRVGRKLTARAGVWKPGAVRLSYHWKRNGKAIRGATKVSYRLGKSDRRKRITVTVTGSKTGYVTISRTSKTTKRIR